MCHICYIVTGKFIVVLKEIMKEWCVLNIFFHDFLNEVPHDDSLEIETCSNVE